MKQIAMSCIAFGAIAAATPPAFAEWQVDNGVAIVAPTTNNSTMELLAISCGDPYQVEVYSRGGPVRPDTGDAATEADYFYMPGKVEARIDTKRFALAAAGSDAAVVLFSQGKPSENHLAPIERAFIEALKEGTTLVLAFDVTAEANAQDGTPHETLAEFPLNGSRAVLDEALSGCR